MRLQTIVSQPLCSRDIPGPFDHRHVGTWTRPNFHNLLVPGAARPNSALQSYRRYFPPTRRPRAHKISCVSIVMPVVSFRQCKRTRLEDTIPALLKVYTLNPRLIGRSRVCSRNISNHPCGCGLIAFRETEGHVPRLILDYRSLFIEIAYTQPLSRPYIISLFFYKRNADAKRKYRSRERRLYNQLRWLHTANRMASPPSTARRYIFTQLMPELRAGAHVGWQHCTSWPTQFL